MLVAFLLLMPVVSIVNAAEEKAPTTNISDEGFKLVVCDGPEAAGHVSPTGASGERNIDGSYKYPLKQGYVPCDFNGVMKQIQHIINILIVLGFVVAVLGFSYAGAIYITAGDNPGKITEAHSIFKKVLIGFIIMLLAWTVVYQLLSWLTGDSGFGALLGA
jgi:hypothetical protein